MALMRNMYSEYVTRIEFDDFSNRVDKRFEELTEIMLGQFDRVYTRLDSMDRRFDVIETRLGAIEKRLDAVDKCLNTIDSKIGSLSSDMQLLKAHFGIK